MLTDHFDLTDYVRPACLPSPELEVSDGYGIISGFGSTAQGSYGSSKLLLTQVPILSRSECVNNPNIGSSMTSEMICAGKEGKDTCQGDSGGPLVIAMDNKWTLLGVTSWGLGCGRQNSPGVYVKVTEFIDQIENFN